MTILLYVDVNVRQEIVKGLRRRQVDVLTAQEDGARRLTDQKILDRALLLGRAVFTNDEDFLLEASIREQKGQSFAGVIYAHQRRVSVRRCIDDIEIIAKVLEPGEMANQVIYLPL